MKRLIKMGEHGVPVLLSTEFLNGEVQEKEERRAPLFAMAVCKAIEHVCRARSLMSFSIARRGDSVLILLLSRWAAVMAACEKIRIKRARI